jgi:hypothetical protein
VNIQPRDLDILQEVFVSGLLTSSQIALMYFDGSTEAAKKRLQKLKAERLLATQPRQPYEPSLLFVTKEGRQLLKARLQQLPASPRNPPKLFLQHHLEIQSIKAALFAACRATEGVSLSHFQAPGHELLSKQHLCAALRPDASLRLDLQDGSSNNHPLFYFLEIDRSTETQGILMQKAARYLEYSRRREGFPTHRFRVLFVFTTKARRDNTAVRLLTAEPRMHSLIWLTTEEEFVTNPLGLIWVSPKDYTQPGPLPIGSKSLLPQPSSSQNQFNSLPEDSLMQVSA